jgi:hypothetical protein
MPTGKKFARQSTDGALAHEAHLRRVVGHEHSVRRRGGDGLGQLNHRGSARERA